MRYRKLYFLFGILFWFSQLQAFTQEQKIADSLALIYQQDNLPDTVKFDLLIELSFHEVKDLNKGLRYAEELIGLAENAGNSKYLRVGYFLKGNKHRLMGNRDEALEAYFKSAEIARKSKYLKGEGESYGAIADIYSGAENYSNALRYYHQAITILRNSKGDSISLASVLSNAGEAYFKTKNYDSALFYFNEARALFEMADYTTGTAYCQGNIGMVFASLGQHLPAEKNINEAIAVLEPMQDYYPICVYLLSLADMYFTKGQYQLARNYAARSLGLAEASGLKQQIADASLKLSGIYEKTGDPLEALKQYKKHVLYRDSITNLKMVQELADLRTNFEVSQKQNEVDVLSRKKQNQQTTLVFLFIILGLTLLLLGGLFWFYRFKTKEKARVHQNELLHARLEIQEQTYQNISQELHDNIGQVLSLVKININLVDNVNPEVAKEKLTESRDLLTKAIQDLRDVSKTLNTDFINQIGLTRSIEQQVQLLNRTGIYNTQLSIKGPVYSFEPQRELLIFRIVQELLNNIVKHAGADQIGVAMLYETEKLVITVRDNGKGFNVNSQQAYAGRGLGLRNIYNRLKLIRGSISFQEASPKGTTATLEIQK